MSLRECRECRGQVSTEAAACPHCGAAYLAREKWSGTGVDWKSSATVLGYPLVHVAFGRDARGKLRVARGVIAIGQFAIGVVTVAQFGVGFFLGVGQLLASPVALAQFAIGYVVVAQFGLGVWVLAQYGWASYLWSVQGADQEAVQFFRGLWARLSSGG